ncbi:MAG: 50S ribosomal protein L4 [Magnetococcales bacterium]|nr:50S ribosomal protein L4 [Magnetococcales bacterium]
MIEFPVKDISSRELKTIQLNPVVFGREVRGDILNMVVTYQMAKRRTGSACAKGRSDVSGGGRKPYRQKGTGNARQGTIRAPQYRTGGVVFGPKPMDYSIKVPKKVRRLGLQIALSAKIAAGEMTCIDDFGMSGVKTKDLLNRLEGLGAGRSTLIVLAEEDRTIMLSARNLPDVSVIRVEGVNVYDVLAHRNLLVTEAALQKLEERLV